MSGVAAERPSLAERVARRSGVNRASVDVVLAAHAVPPAAVRAAARTLSVRRLRVVGHKVGVPSAGPFDRTFRLPLGVVMAVGPNLRGKTSLLEAITLCLRGTPRELQPDVAGWLQAIECDVELNGKLLGFRIKLSGGAVTSGYVYEAQNETELERVPAPGTRVLLEAASAQEYADEVEALMLDRLGLEPILNVTKGDVNTHGWPTYFGALYPPSGGEKILLGVPRWPGWRAGC